MNKLLSSLIVLVLVVPLVACSAPPPTSATTAPVHITMWSIAVEADANHKAFANAVAAYNAKHKDVQIDITYIEDSSFKNQLQIAIGAGNPPDIFQDWGGGVLQSMVEAGVVREIKALSGDTAKKFIPAALGPSTFNGKHYGVPSDVVLATLFYNKSLFAQYNVELPTTWTKFLAACSSFKAVGIVPAAVGNKSKWPGVFYMDYLVNRIGGQDAYLKATYDQAKGGTYTDSTFVEAWTKLQEAVRAGCFEDGINGMAHADAGLMVATGKAAMQLQGNWFLSYYRQIDKDFTDKNIDFMPFPAVEGGKGNPADLMGGTGQAMVISAKAPPQAEEALLEMMTSLEYAQDLVAASLIPATSGRESLFANDPGITKIVNMLSAAPNLHLFYGTDLPPKWRTVYDDVTQQIYGLATTPDKAAADLQAAAQSNPIK